MKPARALATLTILAVPALLLACSDSTTTKSSPPVVGGYEVVFPSTAAAVATDTVQVSIYEATSVDICQTLVQNVLANAELPTPLVPTVTLPVCATVTGGDAGAPAVTIPFGDRAVVAVALSQGKGIFVGCTAQKVDALTPTVVVPLTNEDPHDVSIPTTTCLSLSQHCSNACK